MAVGGNRLELSVGTKINKNSDIFQYNKNINCFMVRTLLYLKPVIGLACEASEIRNVRKRR
jgi:hypothetical protein